MTQLLRLLRKQRKKVDKKALISYVEELHYLYNKHTRGKLVADQYKINQAAKSMKDSAGLLDMKEIMSAQKQVDALQVLQEPPKNAGDSTKTLSSRKTRRNKTWTRTEKQAAETDRPAISCFKCRKPGHRARDCPSTSAEKK